MQNQFKSLLRAIDILILLEKTNALSVAEISNSLGLPRSTTYKYLAILRKCRFVDYALELEKYRLGMKCFELGSAVQDRIEIGRVARPYLEKLSNQSGETVGLNVVDEDGYIYVEKVEPENTSGFVFLLRKGIRFPLHAGAAGKILLAYQPEEKIEGFLKANKFEKYTEKTVLDPAELRKQLKAIRKAGYAFSEEEISLGVRAFAAPIFNHEGKISAGLTVFGPIQRITGPKKETILKLILEYSQKISEEIGGTAAKKAAR